MSGGGGNNAAAAHDPTDCAQTEFINLQIN